MNTSTNETVFKADTNIVRVSLMNTRQPTAAEVGELIQSIREHGQTTPALARPHPSFPGEYELAAGARRRTACHELGIQLDLIVREMTDAELEDTILIDNLQHEDPSPESEADLIRRRLDEGMTPSAIAAKYGKADIWVLRRMKLLEIVPALLAELKPGEALAHYTTEMRERLGSLPATVQEEIASDRYYFVECKSMEELKDALERIAEPLKDCEWLEDPDTFIEGCGPGCATDTNKSVFPEPGGECGRCMNDECFFARRAKAIDKGITAALGGRELKDVVFFRSFGYEQVVYQGKSLSYLHEYQFKEQYKISKTKKGTGLIGIDLAVPARPVVIFLDRKVKKNGSGASGVQGAKDSREDKLVGKRLALMNSKVKAAIEEAGIPEGVPILNLVAAFGLCNSRTYYRTEDELVWESLRGPGEVPDLDRGSKLVSREDSLWTSIKPILRQRLYFEGNLDMLKPYRRAEMERIAELIGFDYKGAWLKVCFEEVPVPKSWGKGIDALTLEKEAA